MLSRVLLTLVPKKGAATLQYVHLPGLVWHAQLSRYQEQAQLLDPHLSSIVEPLAAVLRENAKANLSEDTSAIVAVSQMLWAVATIRSVRCPPAFPVFAALPKPDFGESHCLLRNTSAASSAKGFLGRLAERVALLTGAAR